MEATLLWLAERVKLRLRSAPNFLALPTAAHPREKSWDPTRKLAQPQTRG